jgi:zinc protease
MLDRQTPPAYQQVADIKLQNATLRHLPKGVPLHILNAGKQEVIRIEAVFRAGAVLEQKGAQAFFATKMLSEGTTRYTAKEIAAILDSHGAHIDLSPGFDYSTVSVYTLSKHVSVILPLLKSILTEPNFPEQELESLKDIKQQKLRIDNKKDAVVASKRFRNKLFGDHPYGNFLKAEEIATIQTTDLEGFFRQYMHQNFEIMVAGDVNSEVERLIEQTFGDLSYKKLPESAFPEPLTETIERENIPRSGSLQSSIRMGKRLFKLDHPDFNRFSVLNTIFGGYFGSRLMKSIREEKGYTYGIYSNVVPMKQAGYFVIGTDVIGEHTEQTMEEIHKEIHRLQTVPVEEDELETVKNYMLGSFLSSLNTPFALADRYKTVYLHQLSENYYHDYVRDINQVTSRELQELSQRYLSPEEFTSVVVGNV